MPPTRLLAEATELARKCSYQIREEDLDGAGGGHCFFAGKKWLLLDVTQSTDEQLRDVIDALRDEPGVGKHTMSPELSRHLPLLSRAA